MNEKGDIQSQYENSPDYKRGIDFAKKMHAQNRRAQPKVNAFEREAEGENENIQKFSTLGFLALPITLPVRLGVNFLSFYFSNWKLTLPLTAIGATAAFINANPEGLVGILGPQIIQHVDLQSLQHGAGVLGQGSEASKSIANPVMNALCQMTSGIFGCVK